MPPALVAELVAAENSWEFSGSVLESTVPPVQAAAVRRAAHYRARADSHQRSSAAGNCATTF